MPKNPAKSALMRRVVMANDGTRSVRIAAYPYREGQTTGITLGIGREDPDKFSKIYFEITPEVWAAVTEAVEEAFRIVGERAATNPEPVPVKRGNAKNAPGEPKPAGLVANHQGPLDEPPGPSPGPHTGRRQRRSAPTAPPNPGDVASDV